MPWPIGEEGGA